MKHIVVLFLTFTIGISGLCQEHSMPTTKMGTLKIGDKVPSLPLDFLANDGGKRTLSDYKGKVVLLDFWATWCGSCIASLPYLHEIQEKYKDKVQIILVNDNEKRELPERFIRKRINLSTRITLPVVMGDSVMTKVLFKHQLLPVVYWIDADGIIRNITSTAELKNGNLSSFLNGQPLMQEDARRGFESRPENLLWKSNLEKGSVGFNFSILTVKENGLASIFSKSSSMIDLFRFAYGTVKGMQKNQTTFVEPIAINRVILEATDQLSWGRHYSNYLQPDNTFFYQMIAPDSTSPEKMLAVMRTELDNWFGFTAKLEKRKIQYLSLTIPDSTKLIRKAGDVSFVWSDTGMSIHNVAMQRFLSTINQRLDAQKYFFPRYPIINESGYKGVLSYIEIDGISMNDEKKLDAALSKFGIRLTLKEKEIEMLVITESNEKGG